MDLDADNRGAGGKAPRNALRPRQTNQEPKRQDTPLPKGKGGSGFFSILRSPIQAGFQAVKAWAPSPRGAEKTNAGNPPTLKNQQQQQQRQQQQQQVMPPPPPPSTATAMPRPPQTAAPADAPTSNGSHKALGPMAVNPVVASTAFAPHGLDGWSPAKVQSLNFFLKGAPGVRPPDVAVPRTALTAPSPGVAPDTRRPYLGLKYLLRSGPSGVNAPSTWVNHQTQKPIMGDMNQKLAESRQQQANATRFAPYTLQPPREMQAPAAPGGMWSPLPKGSLTPLPKLFLPAVSPLASLPRPPATVRLAESSRQTAALPAPPSGLGSLPRVRFAGTPMPKGFAGGGAGTPGAVRLGGATGGGGTTPGGNMQLVGAGGMKRSREAGSPGSDGGGPSAITPLVGSGIKNLAEYKRQRQRYTTQVQSKAVTSFAAGMPRTPREVGPSSPRDRDSGGATPLPGTPHPGAATTETARRILATLDNMAKAADGNGGTPAVRPSTGGQASAGSTPYPRSSLLPPPLDRLTPAERAGGPGAASVRKYGLGSLGSFTPMGSPTPTANLFSGTRNEPYPFGGDSTPEPSTATAAAAALPAPPAAFSLGSVAPAPAPAASKPHWESTRQPDTPVPAFLKPAPPLAASWSDDASAQPSRGAALPEAPAWAHAHRSEGGPLRLPTAGANGGAVEASSRAFAFGRGARDEVSALVSSITASAPSLGSSALDVPRFKFGGSARSSTPLAAAQATAPMPAEVSMIQEQVSNAASVPLPDDDDEDNNGGEPVPTATPAPAPAAPASGGWGTALLSSAAKGLAAASTAVAEELAEKAAPKPSSASDGVISFGTPVSKQAPFAAATTTAASWDMSFLQNNQASLSAASDAVAREVDAAKAGAASAPASGGWDLSFLQKSQAALSSGTDAVAKELEDKRVGGGSHAPTPAAATSGGGWGAAFLQGNQTSMASANQAVAGEIEAVKSGAAAAQSPTGAAGFGSPFPFSKPSTPEAGFGMPATASSSPATFTFGAAATPAASAAAAGGAAAPPVSPFPSISFGAPQTTAGAAASASFPAFGGGFTFGAAPPTTMPSSTPATATTLAPGPAFTFGAAQAATPAAAAASSPVFTFGAASMATTPAQPCIAPSPFGSAVTLPQASPSPAPSFGAAPSSGAPTPNSFAFGPTPGPAGAATTPSTAGFAFGSSAPTPATNPAQAASPFPPSSAAFGSAIPATHSPLFGSTPAAGAISFTFGAQQQSAPQPQAQAGPQFGQAQPSGFAFGGASHAPPQEPSPYGAAPSPSPFFGAPSPWPSAATFGAQPSPAPSFGGFAASPAPAFGQQQGIAQPAFGGTPSPAPAFGNFGAAPTAGGMAPAFGGPATDQGGGGFNMGTAGDTGGTRRKLKARRHGA